MLARQNNLAGINGWTIIYAIINFFVFGFSSGIFTYNLIVIVINLLYFKYILKSIDLNNPKPYK